MDLFFYNFLSKNHFLCFVHDTMAGEASISHSVLLERFLARWTRMVIGALMAEVSCKHFQEKMSV